MMIEISLIVICHNSDNVISRCHQELSTVLSTLGIPAELVYVENGSDDDTLFRLQELIKEDSSSIPSRIVVLKRYTGLSSAFLAGVYHSSGKIIITIDPALTVDPVEITRVVEEVSLGYDVVMGWRQRQHLPIWIQRRSLWINRIASWITGVHLHDYGTPLRAFRRSAIQHIPSQGDLYPFAPVFIVLAGGRVSEIKVIYRRDYYIQPEYSPNGYITGLLDLLVVWFLSRFLNRPLGFFGRVGLACFFLAGLAWGFEKLGEKPRNSIFSEILLASGVQAFLLGLNAELAQYISDNNKQELGHRVVEVIE